MSCAYKVVVVYMESPDIDIAYYMGHEIGASLVNRTRHTVRKHGWKKWILPVISGNFFGKDSLVTLPLIHIMMREAVVSRHSQTEHFSQQDLDVPRWWKDRPHIKKQHNTTTPQQPHNNHHNNNTTHHDNNKEKVGLTFSVRPFFLFFSHDDNNLDFGWKKAEKEPVWPFWRVLTDNTITQTHKKLMPAFPCWPNLLE